MLAALLVVGTLCFLAGAIAMAFWFGSAVDDAARAGEERGRAIERNAHPLWVLCGDCGAVYQKASRHTCPTPEEEEAFNRQVAGLHAEGDWS